MTLTGRGEIISGWLYEGPGPTSFYRAAAALDGVAHRLQGILDGHHAHSCALLAAWASPAGKKAVSAHTPYKKWLGETASHIQAAATDIHATGAAFDHAKAMTRSPTEFAVLDWTCLVMMYLNPLVLGALTAAIAQNRATHCAWTAAAETGYAHYKTASTTLKAALVPVTPPPGTVIPAAKAPISGGSASNSGGSAPPEPGASGLLSGLGALPSSLGALPSSLSALPSSMASGLGLPTAGSGNAGANGASWLGASVGGGTVAASLSGGGAGFGRLGGAAASAPMRGPVAWASTANAVNPQANPVVVSRIADARAASTMPATANGMGVPGAMAPAARQTSESERERGLNQALSTMTVLYRTPTTTR